MKNREGKKYFLKKCKIFQSLVVGCCVRLLWIAERTPRGLEGIGSTTREIPRYTGDYQGVEEKKIWKKFKLFLSLTRPAIGVKWATLSSSNQHSNKKQREGKNVQSKTEKGRNIMNQERHYLQQIEIQIKNRN